MSEPRKYNTDSLFIFPLIGDGVVDFVTDYTPAAGDAKVWTDELISTNLSAFILGFDSMSEKPTPGDQIDENGAGTAQAIVMATVIVSGTVGGGDAAGFFFVRSVSGQAWSNNDQIDINGGTANIATADSTTYDLAATSGLIGDVGNGMFACALTPTEMSCIQGEIHIVDSATKAIEDQAIRFHTYGNASALHAMDFDDAVRGGMTALPNADADAAGGLPISDLGGVAMDLISDAGDGLPGIKGIVDLIFSDTGFIKADTNELQTDWADGGRLDLIQDAILVDTAVIGSAGAGLTAIPWNSSWDTEVQSEVNDALVALGLDHLVNVAVVGADITDDSIIAQLVSKSATADWDDFVNTTDSLQAIRDKQTDIETDTAEIGAAGAGLTAITGVKLAATGLDLVMIDGKTFPVATQIIAAAAIGIISGAGTGTEVFKGLDKTTTRATVTVDGSGNRSAIIYV